MTIEFRSPDDTVHRLTRKGLDLKVRVAALPGGEEYGHLLVFGAITEGCLVRIHSRCFYGEVLRSEDCDCGAEIDATMDMIQAAGAGVLIYMEQEGRGAGLVNKARGYHVQERTGANTFDSYRSLGLDPDSRDYLLAITGLLRLDIASLRVMTNNPDKIGGLRYAGFDVSVVPLLVPPCNERVRQYLEAKRTERHHWIPASLTARVVRPETARAAEWTSQSAPMGGYAVRAPRFNKARARRAERRALSGVSAKPVPQNANSARETAKLVRETDFDAVEVWDDAPPLSGARGIRALLWEIKRRWIFPEHAAVVIDHHLGTPPRVSSRVEWPPKDLHARPFDSARYSRASF